jgi:hypothetical protein
LEKNQMPKRELFDATLQYLGDSTKAIKVTEGEFEDAVWLPKSLIEYEVHGTLVTVTMPAWLAAEKKFAGA